DRRAPRVTLSGLSGRTSRALLRGRGLRPRLTCDEACSLTLKVTARKRVGGKEKTVTLRTVQLSGRTTEARTVALKLSGSVLRGVLRRKLTVAMVATDGSGNATSVVRGVKVAR
ncbi:MAG TPA: hypothetical protein VN238_18170, partial [Solirubrobacteraceae bacterium]|nr:hypothetical protein [Solirubrobacteraceae bacterium]